MLKGHFVSSIQGNVFVTQFGDIKGDTAILCLPSITEEMNLSRAVIAKQLQAFSQASLPCFVVDYYGTGDSEGEFEHADCNIWLKDVIAVGEWLQQQGIKHIVLFGIRFGGLITLAHQEYLHQKLPIVRQILWKPVINGKQFFGQFIRIKQANEMLKGNEEKKNWRQEIIDGNDVEVAGYKVGADLLNSSEQLIVNATFNPLCPVDWFELSSSNITPATKKIIADINPELLSIGAVECPPFWQVPEVFDLPALVQETLTQVTKKLNQVQ